MGVAYSGNGPRRVYGIRDLHGQRQTGVRPERSWDDGFVKSLLHFDTDLTDESGKTWTAYGGAAVSNARSRFGGKSLLLGAGKYLSTAQTGDFDFGTDPFTVDFQIWAADVSLPAFQFFMGANNGSFMLAFNNSFTGIGFGRNNIAWDGSVIAGMSNSTWHHFAFVRSGSNVYIFRDGTLLTTYNVGSTSYAVTGTTYIGGLAAQFNATCNINEFRVSKGISRWTEEFTPPSAAYG